MKLSEFKNSLPALGKIRFQLPDGSFVPSHFHITEMGLLTKNYIDCGNTVREENVVTFQLWFSTDLDHRLTSDKILKIIAASQNLIGDRDPEIEVEYQLPATIGKFGLAFADGNFILTPKQTACLAEDQCGIPTPKKKISLRELQQNSNCCSPESGCC